MPAGHIVVLLSNNFTGPCQVFLPTTSRILYTWCVARNPWSMTSYVCSRAVQQKKTTRQKQSTNSLGILKGFSLKKQHSIVRQAQSDAGERLKPTSSSTRPRSRSRPPPTFLDIEAGLLSTKRKHRLHTFKSSQRALTYSTFVGAINSY